jgi:hypothetical protein
MSCKNNSSKPIDLVSSCEEEDDVDDGSISDVDVIELIYKKPAATATITVTTTTTTAQRNKKKKRKTQTSHFNNTDTDKSKRTTIIDLVSGEEDDDGIFDVDVIELVSDDDDDEDDGGKTPAADLIAQWRSHK